MSEYWGYHLIVDAGGCNHEAMTNRDRVVEFAKELVTSIDMVAFGEPQVHDFGTGNKAGFTLVQLIETSNICAHFANEADEIYLDVFSCKDFDDDTVLDIFQKYFDPIIVNVRRIIRAAPSP